MEINLNNHNKLRIRYAKNFRAPTFNDRFWLSSSSVGNENLNSENADNYEIYIISNIKIIDSKFLYIHCMLTIGLHGQKKTVYGLQKILNMESGFESNFNLNIEIQCFFKLFAYNTTTEEAIDSDNISVTTTKICTYSQRKYYY